MRLPSGQRCRASCATPLPIPVAAHCPDVTLLKRVNFYCRAWLIAHASGALILCCGRTAGGSDALSHRLLLSL